MTFIAATFIFSPHSRDDCFTGSPITAHDSVASVLARLHVGRADDNAAASRCGLRHHATLLLPTGRDPLEERRVMSERFDLIVIGGGPAGSAAAITAGRKGHRVALLERGTFPRHKVCGEFVSAESLAILNGLIGASLLSKGEHPRIASARIFIDGKVRHLHIEPAAASIPRFELDAALWHAAKDAGVITFDKTTVSEVSGEGPYRISAAGRDYVSRAVINASGRWSNVGSELKPSLDAKLGVKAHFREQAPAGSVDLFFFEGGYCGVQPIGRDTINVSAMVSPAAAKDLQNVFRLNTPLLERSKQWTAITEQVSTYPLVFREPAPIDAERSVFNTGDAAAFIDPFVGDGISMALHSGTLSRRIHLPLSQWRMHSQGSCDSIPQ